jgi:hypothetical protein
MRASAHSIQNDENQRKVEVLAGLNYCAMTSGVSLRSGESRRRVVASAPCYPNRALPGKA